MIILGAVILIVLSGFIVSVIITLLKILVAVVGIFLVLGGIALLIFGGRFSGVRRWGWDEHPAST